MIIFIFLSILNLSSGLNMKMKMTPQNIYNNRFTYKVEPINQLLSNIESKKVDKVIFSPEMDTVVTQTKETKILESGKSKKVNDYSVTKMNPHVTDYVTEMALKQGQYSVFRSTTTHYYPNTCLWNFSIGNWISIALYSFGNTCKCLSQ